MAEIRKHNPKVTDDIDRALLAALGEDVRPVEPGSKPARGGAVTADPDTDPAARPGSAFGLPATAGGWVNVAPVVRPVSEPDSVVDPDDVYTDQPATVPTDDQPVHLDDDYR